MEKIKLVVIDEHTLGFIIPGSQYANVLHASVLRGAYSSSDLIFNKGRKVRLANEQDFEDYRVCFEGYKKRPEEYEFDPTPMKSPEVKRAEAAANEITEMGDFKKGDKVVYTNEYGVTFDRLITGFCKPTSWGGCVYLNKDSYWFPVPPSSIVKSDAVVPSFC